jgi:hypothetical protein
MINVAAFRRKTKQLRAQINKNKRLLKNAVGGDARRLAALIADDEEQIAINELMVVDVRARVQALYDADCYGGPH